MTTLQAIAQATGVSVSTVSRVLCGRQAISEKTRRRVTEALQESGYARTRKQQRRGRPHKSEQDRKLALVCSDRALVRQSPFLAPIHDALLSLPGHLGAEMAPVEWPAHLESLPADLQGLEGAVCIGFSEGHLPRLVQRMPTVVVDTYFPGSGADGVVADYTQGVCDAVTHLLGAGHSRIALLSASRTEQRHFGFEVYEGARRAHRLAGKEEWAGLVAGCVTTPEDGYTLARALLRRPADQRPTAVLGSDHAMLGVYRAASDEKLRIPQDLAVIGVDDIELARYAVPRLSSVRVEKEALARTAAERLLWRLANPGTAVCRIVLDCKFMRRDSC